jgi:chromosome segregation ATPase
MPTQDELIQAELDGTIEELEAKADEQEAETPNQETVEQPTEEVKEEVKEEASSEKTSNTPKDTTTEKQSSVMKLLKQRNEARAELEQMKAQAKNAADLEARIKELEEGIAAQELQKEAEKEKADFYEKYPSAK